MSDYDYGNARLHAMKSRLLSSRELEALVSAGSLHGLIAVLTKTAYQKSVETALTRTSGINCIDDALRNNLENTIGKIGDFYSGNAGKMVAIVLRVYDIHNVKAILQGLSKNVPAGEILMTLLPVGELKTGVLRDLAGLRTPRDAIDLLASMSLPFARPLLKLRAEHPGAEIFEMELALDQWHYQEAHRHRRSGPSLEERLSSALTLDADLANVLTILRFAREPAERRMLSNYFSDDGIERLFIGPGRITFELIENAFYQDSVAAAIETLSGTVLGPALQVGLKQYQQTQRLSDIEKQLKRYRLEWMGNQIIKDPLGIGVVLGYISQKSNEVGNIRWIAQGINLGLEVEAIRAGLETFR